MRHSLGLLCVLAACARQAPPPAVVGNATPPAPAAPAKPVVVSLDDQLADPAQAERTLLRVEERGDPSAIPTLGRAWEAQGRPVRILQVIIELARPLTPPQARELYLTDYEKTGRAASWNLAEPFLIKALVEVDEANPRSLDNAQKAADAVGESRLANGLDALIERAQAPVTKRTIAAQVAALRAIGQYAEDKAKAAAALLRVLDRDPPDHPRLARDKDQGRAMEERFGLFLGITGATINSLAALHVPQAAKPLVLAMYRTPELFMQTRRALVASGPTAENELRSALRGENAEVNQLFKDRKLDLYCGDRNDAPPNQCEPVSAREFYAAVVLGDFYDPAVVPDLLAVLDHKPYPPYYADDQPSGSTQHNAVFDALRKIGSPDGAAKIRALWQKQSKDLTTRILAIGAYPFVARDGAGVPELGKIAADNTADDGLRTEAAIAFARLSSDVKDIAILVSLADRYLEASAKKQKDADKRKKDAEAADAKLATVKQALDDAKVALLKITKDTSSTAAQIQAATQTAKQREDDYRDAKKLHKSQTEPYRMAASAAKAYQGYARMFQTHIARISVALRCKQDLACYADTLGQSVEKVAGNSAPYIKDIASWTDDEKLGLLEGEIERAMLELGKAGPKAAAYTEPLLDAAKSDDRLIRQSVLLALPKIAKVPCPTCIVKLDAAIRAGEGKTTLGDLNLETTMLRNYFEWAGGKTPPAP